jgi:hypothetical protein
MEAKLRPFSTAYSFGIQSLHTPGLKKLSPITYQPHGNVLSKKLVIPRTFLLSLAEPSPDIRVIFVIVTTA